MNYKEEIFKLVILIKKFILDSDNLLSNIPRKDYYNRDKFRNDITYILYLVYLSNNIRNNEKRLEHQYDILARLSMMDFYLERAYVYKYISEKQLFNFSKRLEAMVKMVKAWMNINE